MGLIIKIVLFGVVVYGIWKTANRWYGFLSRFLGNAPPQPPPVRQEPPPASPPTPPAPRVVVEDTRLCAVCGAYVATGAPRCGQSGCPQP